MVEKVHEFLLGESGQNSKKERERCAVLKRSFSSKYTRICGRFMTWSSVKSTYNSRDLLCDLYISTDRGPQTDWSVVHTRSVGGRLHAVIIADWYRHDVRSPAVGAVSAAVTKRPLLRRYGRCSRSCIADRSNCVFVKQMLGHGRD